MILETNIEQLREKYIADNYIAFSMDIDWASEYCITEMLDFFDQNDIPLNVFCTHPSKVLEERRNRPNLEFGIHPNYSPGSSQGSTIDEATDYCMKLVPEARSVRGHRWYSCNDMYDRLVKEGIRYDSNECTMLDLAQPYIHRSGVLRMPVYFEDGGFLWSKGEPDFKANGKKYFDRLGLKVLDLHPIHFAINSPTLEYYWHVRDTLSREEYSNMSRAVVERIRFKGKGIRDYVMDLVEYVKAKGIRVVSLGQVFDELIFYNL